MRNLAFLSFLGAATAATFSSCTSTQITTLQTAITRATQRAYAAIHHLESHPHGSALQTAYYGTFDRGRYARILTAFRTFAPDLEDKFHYDCGCESGVVIASPTGTYGGVRICGVYFDEGVVPGEGYRSRWSTLIHEATHFRETLDTVDHGYTPEVCKRFAREDPVMAVENADNHANFAVEV